MVHSLKSVIGIAKARVQDVDYGALVCMVDRRDRLLRRIATAAAEGRTRDRRDAVHKYLESGAVRVLAIIRAQRGM